jgi:hypothetical protein
MDALASEFTLPANGSGAMTVRTTSSTVGFGAPFKLAGHDEMLTAGI